MAQDTEPGAGSTDLPEMAGEGDLQPPETAGARDPAKTSSKVLRWRDRFELRVPSGWSHESREVDAHTAASPTGVPSKATLLTSPNQTHLLVTFIDGRAMALGMAAQTQRELVEAYLDVFFLTIGAPSSAMEPWACELELEPLTTPLGLEVTTLSLPAELGETDEPEAPLPTGPFYACAARDATRGGLVVVLGWAGLESALGRVETQSEVRMLASRVSLVGSSGGWHRGPGDVDNAGGGPEQPEVTPTLGDD